MQTGGRESASTWALSIYRRHRAANDGQGRGGGSPARELGTVSFQGTKNTEKYIAPPRLREMECVQNSCFCLPLSLCQQGELAFPVPTGARQEACVTSHKHGRRWQGPVGLPATQELTEAAGREGRCCLLRLTRTQEEAAGEEEEPQRQ